MPSYERRPNPVDRDERATILLADKIAEVFEMPNENAMVMARAWFRAVNGARQAANEG